MIFVENVEIGPVNSNFSDKNLLKISPKTPEFLKLDFCIQSLALRFWTFMDLKLKHKVGIYLVAQIWSQ